MPATVNARSDRERIIRVYSEQPRTSSGGSVRSPATSESSRSSDGSWQYVPGGEDDDDIDPSDSASHSRRHRHSRRHHVEAPVPPSRHSSRRGPSRDEESPPPRHRKHTSSRARPEGNHGRSHSRRVPSDESTDSVAGPADDYPYGHHGMRPYPAQQSGYRHVPAQGHGGFPGMPGSMTGGYPDPYNPQALVQTQRPDPFAAPGQPNPFATNQHPNPFSPISGVESSSYFSSDPMSAPPPPVQPQRPPGGQRPPSFAAPYHGGYELMPAYPQGYPGQGYPPQGYPGQGWPPHMMPPYGWHSPSHAGSPAPAVKDEEPSRAQVELEALKAMLHAQSEAHAKAVEEQRKATEEHRKALEDAKPKPPKPIDPELEAQRALLTRLQEDVLKAQKAFQEEREAEAAARAAAKAREEEDKKRKAEIAEASKKAKEDAEKKAAEAAAKLKEEMEKAAAKAKDEAEKAAAKAKEEYEKKMAEITEAKEAADKEKKALAEEAAKYKPSPDSLKAPIKFKDAVGRKFSFPWHLCKSWKGMEGLIKQAFLHVDLIGEHVHQGHYDLTGPDGEIILPQVWDTMVQPDWEITMHLWPMPEDKVKEDRLAADVNAMNDPFANLGLGDLGLGPPPGMGGPPMGKPSKSGSKKGKSKAAGGGKAPVNEMMLPPDPFAAFAQGGGGLPPGITAVMPDEKKVVKRPKAKSKSTPMTPWQAWVLGSKPSKKK